MVLEIIVSVVLLVAGISAFLLIHICIVSRAFPGDEDDHDHQNIVIFEEGSARVVVRRGGGKMSNEEEVTMESRIPCFSYTEGRDGSASAVIEYCVVCLEKLAVGDSCRQLPSCSHCFHAPCIDSWLLQTPVCPICRTRVVGDVVVASPVSDSEEHVSVLVGDDG